MAWFVGYPCYYISGSHSKRGIRFKNYKEMSKDEFENSSLGYFVWPSESANQASFQVFEKNIGHRENPAQWTSAKSEVQIATQSAVEQQERAEHAECCLQSSRTSCALCMVIERKKWVVNIMTQSLVAKLCFDNWRKRNCKIITKGSLGLKIKTKYCFQRREDVRLKVSSYCRVVTLMKSTYCTQTRQHPCPFPLSPLSLASPELSLERLGDFLSLALWSHMAGFM